MASEPGDDKLFDSNLRLLGATWPVMVAHVIDNYNVEGEERVRHFIYGVGSLGRSYGDICREMCRYTMVIKQSMAVKGVDVENATKQENFKKFMEIFVNDIVETNPNNSKKIINTIIELSGTLEEWGKKNLFKLKMLQLMRNSQIPVPVVLGGSDSEMHLGLLHKMNPTAIAETITGTQSKVLRSLLPKEFSGKWSDPSNSPVLSRLATLFNMVSFWVVRDIIYHNDGDIAAQIKKMVGIAEKLYKMHDFNGLQAVLSGLNNVAVQRLSSAWKNVSSKTMSTFESLEEVISPAHGFRNYKKEIGECTGPRIPIISMYLRDLTYVKDGNPKVVKAEELPEVQNMIIPSMAFGDPATAAPIPPPLCSVDDLSNLPTGTPVKGHRTTPRSVTLVESPPSKEEAQPPKDGGQPLYNYDLPFLYGQVIVELFETIKLEHPAKIHDDVAESLTKLDPTLNDDVIYQESLKLQPLKNQAAGSSVARNEQDISTWSNSEITERFQEAGIPAYAMEDLLSMNRQVLKDPTHQTLMDAGIAKLRVRKIVMDVVAKTKSGTDKFAGIYGTPVEMWSVDDLILWMEKLEFGSEEMEAIRLQSWDGARILQGVDNKDLIQIGLKKIKVRKALLLEFQNLAREGRFNAAPLPLSRNVSDLSSDGSRSRGSPARSSEIMAHMGSVPKRTLRGFDLEGDMVRRVNSADHRGDELPLIRRQRSESISRHRSDSVDNGTGGLGRTYSGGTKQGSGSPSGSSSKIERWREKKREEGKLKAKKSSSKK